MCFYRSCIVIGEANVNINGFDRVQYNSFVYFGVSTEDMSIEDRASLMMQVDGVRSTGGGNQQSEAVAKKQECR